MAPSDTDLRQLLGPTLTLQVKRIVRQEWIMGGLVLLALLEGGIIFKLVATARPIHYLPPNGPGLSLPGVIPDDTALEYGKRWMEARYTYTPDTIDRRQRDIRATLDPSLLTRFDAQMKREGLRIKKESLSSQLYPLQAQVLRNQDLEVIVAVIGSRTAWVGSMEVLTTQFELKLKIAPVFINSLPVGYKVLVIDGPSILTAAE